MKKTNLNVDWSKVPECDLIDDFILRRLKRGLHSHILVTGLQGRGKSDFGIRMAERLSERIENGVEFTHTDIVDSFLKLLDRLTKIKSPGEIIMIEEVSVLFPSRRAMAEENVAVGRVLDTIRKKQAILISNAPLYPSVDSHMRAMAEVLVECQNVMRKEKLVRAKAWILQTSPHTGKTYRHRFRRGRVIVPFHYAKQSNPIIREAYERDKDRFLSELYKRLKAKQEKKLQQEAKINPIEKRNTDIVHRKLKLNHPTIRIAKEFGLTERAVQKIVKENRERCGFPLENQVKRTNKGN